MDELGETLGEYFKDRPEIEFAYIFGSMVSGRINALSDIDIAIFLDRRKIKKELYPYGYKAQILTDLMKLLKTNNVDLVVFDEANPLLCHRVLYFGKLIYVKNEKKRVQFQISTIDKYNDFKQIHKLHERRYHGRTTAL